MPVVNTLRAFDYHMIIQFVPELSAIASDDVSNS